MLEQRVVDWDGGRRLVFIVAGGSRELERSSLRLSSWAASHQRRVSPGYPRTGGDLLARDGAVHCKVDPFAQRHRVMGSGFGLPLSPCSNPCFHFILWLFFFLFNLIISPSDFKRVEPRFILFQSNQVTYAGA